MILKDLFYDEVLIQPTSEEVGTLNIVSGYATSAMAHKHLEDLKEQNINLKLNLIVGMVPSSGINSAIHKGFINLMGDEANRFSCSYITGAPSVHSKLYVWSLGEVGVRAYIGSANYTQMAFFNK